MKVQDYEISALQEEATESGDDMQVCICMIALEGEIESFSDVVGNFQLTEQQRSTLETMTQRQARDICAKVISDTLEQAICDSQVEAEELYLSRGRR